MLASLEIMPDHARLWVYQADRVLNQIQIDFIQKHTSTFVENWAAHGSGLTATFAIEHDQFLVLMVDESNAGASGCSIDSSVSFIRQMESALQVSFLDRSKVAIMKDDLVELYEISQVKSKIEAGEITADSTVFNNAVSTYGMWKSSWRQVASESWMKRFFS
ncbi:MAG: hypothetical protein ACI8QD_002430 [Cyclobacteriaceae bacterium]|jgi:hypothetical protein